MSDVQRDDSSPPWRYLALYEIETNDLNALLAAIKERAGTSAMIFSDALALDLAAWLFNPITSRIEG